MSKKLKNAITAMESMMSPESVQRARMKAEQEILSVGTVYFLRQFNNGKGNWTEDRKEELSGITIADIEKDIAALQCEKNNTFSHKNITNIH
jgi:hypothetical protein